MENFDATNGIDTHTQTAKADTLTITNTNQMQVTDFFDGGRGFDTIVIGTTGAGTIIGIGIDPSAAAGFHHYEALAFRNTSGTTLLSMNADQFHRGLIAPALSITGVDGSQQHLLVGVDGTFSAAAWKFAHWEDVNDYVVLSGDANADSLTGSIRGDRINGNAGTDRLTGGRGIDHLSGGSAADIFDFNRTKDAPKGLNHDVIEDFSGVGLDGDHIDLRTIDANSKLAGNQHFKFIGDQNFHHKAGELHFVNHLTYVTVEGDTNGNGKADFQIDVLDNGSLAKGDFFL